MSSPLEGGTREPDPEAEQHDAEEGKLILTDSTKAWDLSNAVYCRFLAQAFGCVGIKLTLLVLFGGVQQRRCLSLSGLLNHFVEDAVLVF